jgi:pimeloyl-ACP methyl ester carboxylesterase
VDDLREMTYTAYKGSFDEENEFSGRSPLDARLAATGLPVLVVFGADDHLYDAQEAIARYRQNVPGVRTRLIPGAGHSPNVERPNALARLILAFAQPPKPRPAPRATKRPAKK